MKKINFGLTGLGRIGKLHLENLVNQLSDVQVVAISDISPEARQLGATYGIPNSYEDFHPILDHSEIEAVVICSPTDTHLEYIKAAAKAGKHIFCEKPLELTVEKIEEIEATVQQYGVKLQVGFNRRFDPNFVKVRSLVESGHIGDPHILKITSRDPGLPPMEYIKGSGGMFMDMTIHDFDMARFIVGSEVVEVYAQGAVLVDKKIGEAGDIDTAIILLKFENGCMATIDNSRKAVYGYDQRLEIFGSKGMSRIGNEYTDTHVFYDQNGGRSPRPLDFFMDRYVTSYYKEMQTFISALKTGSAVPVGIRDALMATRIALAGNRSILEGQPIRIEV